MLVGDPGFPNIVVDQKVSGLEVVLQAYVSKSNLCARVSEALSFKVLSLRYIWSRRYVVKCWIESNIFIIKLKNKVNILRWLFVINSYSRLPE